MMTTKADVRKLNGIKSVVAETVIPGNGLQNDLVKIQPPFPSGALIPLSRIYIPLEKWWVY